MFAFLASNLTVKHPLKACIAASVRYYYPPGSRKQSHFQIYLFDQAGNWRQITFGNRDVTNVAWSAGKAGGPGWLTWVRQDGKPGTDQESESLIAYSLSTGKKYVLRHSFEIFVVDAPSGVQPSQPIYCVGYDKEGGAIFKAVRDGHLVGSLEPDCYSNWPFEIRSPFANSPGVLIQDGSKSLELEFSGKKYDLSGLSDGPPYLPPYDFWSKAFIVFWNQAMTSMTESSLYVVDWKKQEVRLLMDGDQLDWKMGRTLWAYETNRRTSNYGPGKKVWTSQLWLVNSMTWKKKELVSGLAWSSSMVVLPRPVTVK